MYHYTRDLVYGRYPKIKGLDIEEFRKQILFLKSNYEIVTMEEVLDSIEGKTALPEKAMLLTFDDGYIDNYTVALPILNEMCVQGSFFIPGKTFTEHSLLDVNKLHFVIASADSSALFRETLDLMSQYRGEDFEFPPNELLVEQYHISNRLDDADTCFVKKMLQTVLPEKLRNDICSILFEKYVGITESQMASELYMTKDQIRELRRNGMFIGIHGYDHYWLGNLEKDKMEKDLSMALKVMDEFIDNNRWVINYPYGSNNSEVIRFAKLNGAVAGLSTKMGIADIGKDDPFLLPRMDCIFYPPRSQKYKEY